MTFRVSASRDSAPPSYLALFKEADARLRSAEPSNAVDALNAESTPPEGDYRVYRVNRVPESSRPARPYAHPWPDTLPGLGARGIVAFTDCQDCTEAPAWPVQFRRVGKALVAVPGARGTWVIYGARPLCLPCTRRRLGEAAP